LFDILFYASRLLTEGSHSIVKVHQLMQKYSDLIVVPAHDRRVHDRSASLPNFEN